MQGKDVTVAPLANDHLPPAEKLTVHVANLTRNVVIESQNTSEVMRRGQAINQRPRSFLVYAGESKETGQKKGKN